MKIDKKWLDDDGNILPNSNQRSCENPNSFNAIVAIMREKLGYHDLTEFDIGQLNANKHLTNNGRYLTNDYDHEKVLEWNLNSSFKEKLANKLKLSKKFGYERSPERFSHDETNAVSSSSYYFMTRPHKLVIHYDNLFIIDDCTGQTFYRFYDVLVGLQYAKNYNADRTLARKQIAFFANIACKSPIGNTSGKVQAWIRLNGLRLDKEFIECTDTLMEIKKWIDVFQVYFPEYDHPINVMARELYGNE